MDAKLIFNELTQKYESDQARVGTTNPFVTESAAQTLTNKTLTTPVISGAVAASLTSPVITGASTTGVSVTKTVAFVEDATTLTYTGTIPIPAGSIIHDVVFTTSVLWTDSSAAVTVGDTGTATGWFTSTNLAATDLVVGEVLSAKGGIQTWGGKNGAFLVSVTGRMGSAAAGNGGMYYGVADSIIAVVTVSTPSGTAGRSFLSVTYSVGEAIAAVKV